MEYIDTLENFYGESATVYETDTGETIVVFEGSREHHKMKDLEKAINQLYKMGYRF